MKRENAIDHRPRGQHENGSNPHGWLILPGLLAAIFCMLATGCATKPSLIPVSVSCIGTVPERPSTTFGAGEWPGDKAAAQAALIDAALWQGYATKLEVVVAGCR